MLEENNRHTYRIIYNKIIYNNIIWLICILRSLVASPMPTEALRSRTLFKGEMPECYFCFYLVIGVWWTAAHVCWHWRAQIPLRNGPVDVVAATGSSFICSILQNLELGWVNRLRLEFFFYGAGVGRKAGCVSAFQRGNPETDRGKGKGFGASEARKQEPNLGNLSWVNKFNRYFGGGVGEASS